MPPSFRASGASYFVGAATIEIGPNLETVLLGLIPVVLAVVAILRAEQAYKHSTDQATRVDLNTARITTLENGSGQQEGGH